MSHIKRCGKSELVISLAQKASSAKLNATPMNENWFIFLLLSLHQLPFSHPHFSPIRMSYLELGHSECCSCIGTWGVLLQSLSSRPSYSQEHVRVRIRWSLWMKSDSCIGWTQVISGTFRPVVKCSMFSISDYFTREEGRDLTSATDKQIFPSAREGVFIGGWEINDGASGRYHFKCFIGFMPLPSCPTLLEKEKTIEFAGEEWADIDFGTWLVSLWWEENPIMEQRLEREQ